ncbi:hypothetical protein DBZ36_03790 [Alginatibacterium sediminis]|uniref:Semialdehyde dehydrogenase dimerisation domain-containing protein n=1 Tax=Alginatibacterium sediminis TaxID=2164068 RepID=A0A420EG01_9ALTE|nr:Asd/ArgC dimerization domain-containing protein [Alginatibacterium sediminis]RKF19598.1 hypothetical protein DBZ36_03790 [Alginatibacterium sediminis]
MSQSTSLALFGADSTLSELVLGKMATLGLSFVEIYALVKDLPDMSVLESGDLDDEEEAEFLDSLKTGLRYEGRQFPFQSSTNFDWTDVQFVLICDTDPYWLEAAQDAAALGVIVIDLCQVLNDQQGVSHLPLSAQVDEQFWSGQKLFKLPSPQLIQLLSIAEPLHQEFSLVSIHSDCLLSASALGKSGVDELARQAARLLNGLPVENSLFNQQLAFNLLDETNIEQEQLEQSRNFVAELESAPMLLGDESVKVSASVSFLPVFYGDTQNIVMETAYPVDIEEIEQCLARNEQRLRLFADKTPNAIVDAVDCEQVLVSGIRQISGNRFMLRGLSDNYKHGLPDIAALVIQRFTQLY